MSLRWRLILSHTLIVLLCLFIVALAVTALLQGYRNKFAAARLDDMTIPIYIQARALASGQSSPEEVWARLEEQAQETGVYILLVDDEGNVLRQASPEENILGHINSLPEGTLPSDLSKPYHGTFMIPKRQYFVFAVYHFAGLFSTQKTPNIEALVLAVPRQSALSLLVGLSRLFFWAGLIALVVSVVIAILLARSVYRPIRRLTEAAGAIAQGRYDQEMLMEGPAEVKGLARAFNQMAKQVKLSQQRLRDFLADVSHDLRTPLTSIRGFAQAIADGTAKDSEARAKAAQIIEDESKRVIRLVDKLLELSKIESGQIQMLRESVDLKAILEHCQELFTMQAAEKSLRLTAALEPLPPIVGDTDRLEEVFSNLLDNALKHTPQDGQIIIRARQTSPALVEITVADSGPGIPPEELPYVFERFYRADASKSGTGLGLAIARGIVRAHGGDIEARNAPVGGAEFIVTLPINLSAGK